MFIFLSANSRLMYHTNVGAWYISIMGTDTELYELLRGGMGEDKHEL